MTISVFCFEWKDKRCKICEKAKAKEENKSCSKFWRIQNRILSWITKRRADKKSWNFFCSSFSVPLSVSVVSASYLARWKNIQDSDDKATRRWLLIKYKNVACFNEKNFFVSSEVRKTLHQPFINLKSFLYKKCPVALIVDLKRNKCKTLL
jgi:hypothetical protein